MGELVVGTIAVVILGKSTWEGSIPAFSSEHEKGCGAERLGDLWVVCVGFVRFSSIFL